MKAEETMKVDIDMEVEEETRMVEEYTAEGKIVMKKEITTLEKIGKVEALIHMTIPRGMQTMEIMDVEDITEGVAAVAVATTLKTTADLLEEVEEITTIAEEVEDLEVAVTEVHIKEETCLLYTSPSPRDRQKSRMPSSA